MMIVHSWCLSHWTIILAVWFKINFTSKWTTGILVSFCIIIYMLIKYFLANVYEIFEAIHSFYFCQFFSSMIQYISLPKTRRSSHHRCSMKKTFLEMPQNSQENTYQSLFLWPATLLKRDSDTGVFLWILSNF